MLSEKTEVRNSASKVHNQKTPIPTLMEQVLLVHSFSRLLPRKEVNVHVQMMIPTTFFFFFFFENMILQLMHSVVDFRLTVKKTQNIEDDKILRPALF